MDDEVNTAPKKSEGESKETADAVAPVGEEAAAVTPPWIKPAGAPEPAESSEATAKSEPAESSEAATKRAQVGAKPAPPPLHHVAQFDEEILVAERRMFELRLEEAHTLMQLAANKLQQIEDDTYRFMTEDQRQEILDDIVALSHRTGTISSRCTYCRRELTKPMGACAMCGRDVCTECGQKVGDAILHRGNCAMFFEEKK